MTRSSRKRTSNNAIVRAHGRGGAGLARSWRYTLNRWGKEILQQYREGLKETFKAIASNNVPKRTFSKTFPDLLVAKYRYHYIFYLTDSLPKPIIIGVIHERRDIVSRLGERLI